MRQVFTTLVIITIVATAFTSCVVVHDEPQPQPAPQPPRVDVVYDYWTGSRNVEVDGEILNDGPGYAHSVDLEFRFYNQYGDWLYTEYRTYHLDLAPLHAAPFYADFGFRYVYEVDVRVAGVSY